MKADDKEHCLFSYFQFMQKKLPTSRCQSDEKLQILPVRIGLFLIRRNDFCTVAIHEKWIDILLSLFDILKRHVHGLQAKRSLKQFMPYSWDRFEWAIVSTPKRTLQCLGLVIVFLLVELNAFFLKYILWIPPLNPLNTYRLILWFLLGVPAVREYFYFIDGEEVILQ